MLALYLQLHFQFTNVDNFCFLLYRASLALFSLSSLFYIGKEENILKAPKEKVNESTWDVYNRASKKGEDKKSTPSLNKTPANQ